jgi:NTP pyrophosphatase (non-canonical NTP hydrolase)
VKLGRTSSGPFGPESGIVELNELIRLIRFINTKNGWRESAGNPPPREGAVFPAHLALIHSEVSEALEAYRIREWSDTREDGKPIGVGPELADTIIRILDVVDIWEIDIEYEIARVLAFNKTRPYRHGDKVI